LGKAENPEPQKKEKYLGEWLLKFLNWRIFITARSDPTLSHRRPNPLCSEKNGHED
jgi:hypothetical protein